MSFDAWMLALHVLSAFALVAGLVLFWVVVFAVRRAETAQGTLRFGSLTKLAGAAVGVGMVGTIVIGVWLAFSVGGYEIWDPWIVAAIVLWFVAAAFGRRTDVAYAAGATKAKELESAGQTGPDAELVALNRTSSGFLLHALASLAALLILADMIWKPGA